MFGKRIPLPAFLWQGKPIACLPAGKRSELVFPYDMGNTNPMGGGLELDFGRCFPLGYQMWIFLTIEEIGFLEDSG